MNELSPARRARRIALLGATILAGCAGPALAQTAGQPASPQPQAGSAAVPAAAAPTTPAPASTPPVANAQPDGPSTANPSGSDPTTNDIVVTGYRRSLAESTVAKRNSTGFTDSIFAEDIGKFPDTNIAESFNRIPGITISRDITGEGVNVAIRGLGSNFTNVTLNGAPIVVASSGATDAAGTDRSVDLSFFPTDLFTKLTVNKSYTADLLEGGAAGNVDIRNARPFDNPGSHLTYNVQAINQSSADGWGERGSLIASTTNDKFGILLGVSGNHIVSRVDGYETLGYTNPNLSAAQCGATTGCNSTGGGNFTIPATVPANAGNGLVPGTVIDSAFLLAHNPGASIQQIDNGLIPRLGRPSSEFGDRDRLNGVLSAEWRPTSRLHFYVDGLYGYRKNELQRIDLDWVGRNGAAIPLNETFDRTDCSQGCTVTGGTFANSQFFLEYRPYTETTYFYSANPGAEWNITDNLKLAIQGNYTRSTFHRESPTVLVNTAPSSGVTVSYTNAEIPTIGSNVDLNNPANFVWNGGRLNIQDERRVNTTKGVRGDLTWGDDRLNLRVGGNYDDIFRAINGFDNSQAYQNAVCGGNPSVNLPGPNTQPPCQGLATSGTGATLTAAAAAAGYGGTYPTYPGYGTGYTAGQTGPVTYAGSLIPQSQLANYLKPGPAGFITVDWDAFAKASNYYGFHATAPDNGGTNTGASGGTIEEKSPAGYGEVNGRLDFGDNDLRFNLGIRYVHTEQTIGGRVSLSDPRNTPADPALTPADGGRYPNIVSFVTTESSYSNWLPAGNLAFDIGRHAVARLAASETLTRPDPSAQLPGVNFSGTSADLATIGNPALKPYKSKNLDVGFEYYTGREGVIAVNGFHKEVSGFTQLGLTTVPFSYLGQYGITYDSLTPTQQTAINSRGGPTAATVSLQQQVNASGVLKIDGFEFQWVQPLDILTERFGIKGFGFNANATIVDQKATGAAAAGTVALGVAPYTYNVTAFYENHGVSLRVSTTYTAGSQTGALNQNSIPLAAYYSDDYQQYDFSSIFDLEKIFGVRHLPQVTFDIVNFTEAKLRSYYQFENATFTEYNPGRTFLIGVRGTF